MADQKHMAEIFQKIMDLNNKINLLKVALQKYEAKVGIYEDSGASQEALKGTYCSFRYEFLMLFFNL